jgi:uncharacterized N-acetyltransferase ybbJ
MNPHITLAPCRVEHYPALTAYQLTGEQAEFSRPPTDWLSGNIAFSAAQLAVTILRGDEPIGFFVLDSGAGRDDYSANPHAVLLRSMSLNPRHQGNGYARTALVPATLDAFIRAHFPACDEIVLGVHHANRAAVRLYQRAGFANTGRTYDGLKGLQFIYHRVLVREG